MNKFSVFQKARVAAPATSSSHPDPHFRFPKGLLQGHVELPVQTSTPTSTMADRTWPAHVARYWMYGTSMVRDEWDR